MSIYFSSENPKDGGTRGTSGKHGRVFYLKGQMDVERLIDAQMADKIGGVDGTFGDSTGLQDTLYQPVKERGKMLVTGKTNFPTYRDVYFNKNR